MAQIAFLHTSAAHISTFQTLLDTLAPDIAAEHFVDAALLPDARTQGLDEPSLVPRIHPAMRTATGSGAYVLSSPELGVRAAL